MPLNGTAQIFWRVPVADAGDTFRRAAKAVRLTKVLWMTQYKRDPFNFADYQAGTLEDPPSTSFLAVKEPVASIRIPRLTGKQFLSSDLIIEEEWYTPFWESLQQTVGDELAGGYYPIAVNIQIGPHQIWEEVEVEEGQLLAEATLSVTFFASGDPADFDLYRERFLRDPIFQGHRARLEEAFGPSEVILTWQF